MVKFDMVPYINKIIDAIPEKIMGVTSTPAADHLFAVRLSAEARLLPKNQARFFHHTTAQLLFLSRVCRIRSRNQGDIDGTSRIVLPCPSS
jgi:hypothetical protein